MSLPADDDPPLTPADPWTALRVHTPARIALGRSGASLPTRELLAFGIAHATFAKAKVEPDTHRPGANLAHDHPLAEFAVRHRRHHGVKLQQVQLIDADRIERDLPPQRRHQAKGRRVRLEETPRRRLERRNPQRRANRLRHAARVFDNRAMTGMQPVEIAQGDCGAPILVNRAHLS